MAGINLSQSIQEKQALAQGRFFDTGFFVNLSIFLIILAAYGGTVWYGKKLGEDQVTLQQDSALKSAGMKSDESDAIKDLQYRLAAVTERLKVEADPQAELQYLERQTSESVRITSYHWIQEDAVSVIKGVTTNLKYLAQQMLLYKKVPTVQSVHVKNVTYNKAGQIEFELVLSIESKVSSTSQ